MQRSDIHSPANIDPAAYTYIGGFVADPPIGPDGENMIPEEMSPFFTPYNTQHNWYDLLEQSPTRPRETAGQCDHCGAHINYHAVYRHEPTGDHIAVGHDCADNTMGWDSRRSLELARQKNAMEAARKNAEEQKQRKYNIEQTAALFPEAVEILTGYNGGNDFIREVASRFARWGSVKRISDDDFSTQEKVMTAVANAYERDQTRAAEREQAADVPEGRFEIVGTVLSVKEKENDFGVRWVMTVKHDSGWLVWGTVPSALQDITEEEWTDPNGDTRRTYRMVDKGDKVKFTARVSASDRDPKFGFFSRPSKAVILEEAV